jgi:hypothetical protein
MTLAATIEPQEYEALVAAPVMFKYSFSYDVTSGQIEFYTDDGRQLAKDLATVIDAGETSWSEVLH